jgi:hypothetical protein
MSTTKISCTVGTSDPTAVLGIEVWLDKSIILDTDHVTHEVLPLEFDVDDNDSAHELRFVLKNKTQEHTRVDEDGNIVSDATLTISNLAFEEIELNQIFYNQAVYTHDFNGTGSETNDKFYGTMGCNGTVSLKFSTPIYLWLLESM